MFIHKRHMFYGSIRQFSSIRWFSSTRRLSSTRRFNLLFFSYKIDRGSVVKNWPTRFKYFGGWPIFHNLHIYYQNSKL